MKTSNVSLQYWLVYSYREKKAGSERSGPGSTLHSTWGSTLTEIPCLCFFPCTTALHYNIELKPIRLLSSISKINNTL